MGPKNSAGSCKAQTILIAAGSRWATDDVLRHLGVRLVWVKDDQTAGPASDLQSRVTSQAPAIQESGPSPHQTPRGISGWSNNGVLGPVLSFSGSEALTGGQGAQGQNVLSTAPWDFPPRWSVPTLSEPEVSLDPIPSLPPPEHPLGKSSWTHPLCQACRKCSAETPALSCPSWVLSLRTGPSLLHL